MSREARQKELRDMDQEQLREAFFKEELSHTDIIFLFPLLLDTLDIAIDHGFEW